MNVVDRGDRQPNEGGRIRGPHRTRCEPVHRDTVPVRQRRERGQCVHRLIAQILHDTDLGKDSTFRWPVRTGNYIRVPIHRVLATDADRSEEVVPVD